MSVIGNVIYAGGGGSGGVSGLGNCLTFTSLSPFTLEVYDHTKHWGGTLEWTDGVNNWAVWNGTTVLSASEGFLTLRGTGNSVITGTSDTFRWSLTGNNIRCDGNIETLLDYATVAAGSHPQMGAHSFHALFYNCTSLTSAPALPATTLADSCYNSMFFNCTSLTAAPSLPATTLADYCYNYMFYGCTSLRMSQNQGGDYQYAYRIPTTGTGTAATFALFRMFSDTGGTFAGTPDINTTYYTTKPPIG